MLLDPKAINVVGSSTVMTIDLDQELSVSARYKVQVPPRIDGNLVEVPEKGGPVHIEFR
jgi:hypothetical protein